MTAFALADIDRAAAYKRTFEVEDPILLESDTIKLGFLMRGFHAQMEVVKDRENQAASYKRRGGEVRVDTYLWACHIVLMPSSQSRSISAWCGMKQLRRNIAERTVTMI